MKKATRILAFTLALVMLLSFAVFADEPTQYEATANYETIEATEQNPNAYPYGTWKAGSNTVYSVMDILPEDSIVSGVATYPFYKHSTTNNANGAAINGPYKKSNEGFNVGNGVKLNKGFGTHPKANQAPVDIIIDIAAYTDPAGEFKCNTFYSLVGLTNVNSPGVYFLVYGDKGDGNYELLGNSDAITGKTLGEFNVDVTGVKNLKLTVITSTNSNDSSACAWIMPSLFVTDAAAAKPASPTLPDQGGNDKPVTPPNVDVGTPTANYETVVATEKNTNPYPYGPWMAGKAEPTSVIDILPVESINESGCYENSVANSGNKAAVNGIYKQPNTGFRVGNKVSFDKGFGTHPLANQVPAEIFLDISAYTDPDGEYKFDTFYVAVALTNTASKGVCFQIYADYGDGSYVLVGNSELIIDKLLGEFNVDVKGVKNLKLSVYAPGEFGSSACAWLNPCLFVADPEAVKPEDPSADNSTKYDKTDNFAEVVWSDINRETRPNGAWMSGKNPVYSLIEAIPSDKLAQTTTESSNYQYYTDSTTLNQYGVSINGPYKKSYTGFTVGTNVPFTEGFGTHPKANQAKTYINLDISKFTDPNGEYKCDTFYSCVGLTNTASKGVYFQVYADYGDGKFVLIGNSTAIIKSNLGEFNIDITGVQRLQLVVITATDDHSGSASAWLAPSVFKKDPNATLPNFANYDPSIEYEKEPVVEAELFTRPDDSTKGVISIKIGSMKLDIPVILLIAVAAGVVVVAGGIVVVIVICKKKKKNTEEVGEANTDEATEETPEEAPVETPEVDAEQNTEENNSDC